MRVSIGFLVFPGFNILDLSGPMGVFETANHHLPDADRYRLTVGAKKKGPVASSCGLTVEAADLTRWIFDYLIVVGGSGVDNACRDSATLDMVARENISHDIISVCTGAFILATSGRLDGRHATTHWRRAAELKRRFPDISLQADRIVVKDGNVWTSAGATAGMDIALAVVQERQDESLAHRVSRELLIPKRRIGGQLQFTTLRDTIPPSPRIQKVLDFIDINLAADLSVEQLAKAAHLSPRQFSREFLAHTGLTPAKAVERMRVEFARDQLENTNWTLAAIADAAGFSDPAQMRKAFVRCLQITPGRLRQITAV